MPEASRSLSRAPARQAKLPGVLRRVGLACGAVACLAAVVAVWATPRIIGDLYVALAAGRDVLAGKLGQPDDWSFLTSDRIWINQNWLSHLTIHVSYLLAGESGLLALKLLLVGGLAGLLVLIARREGTDWPLALVLAGALVAGSRGFIDLRPNLFTLVLAAGMLWTVGLSLRNAHWIWLAVAVELLWSNAHGGFLFGIGMLGLWALCVVIPRAVAHGLLAAARQCWPLVTAPIVSTVLAATVGPFGLGNLTHPLTVAVSEAWRMVAEWRSVFDSAAAFGSLWEFWAVVGLLMGLLLLRIATDALSPRGRPPTLQQWLLEPALAALAVSGAVVAAAWATRISPDVVNRPEFVATFDARQKTTLVIFAPALALSILATATAAGLAVSRYLRDRKNKLDPARLGMLVFHAVLAALTIWMAIRARRFIPLAMVMACPLLARQLQWFAGRTARTIVPILAAAGLIAALSPLGPRYVRHYAPDNPLFAAESFCERMHYSRDSFPAGAADFLLANDLEGRVFEDWAWEGYLHWRCPKLKLFVGDRAQQAYEEAMFLKQEAIRNGQDSDGRDSGELLASFRIPLAVVPLNGYDAFLNTTALKSGGAWAAIYCDGQTIVIADTSYAEYAMLVQRLMGGQLRYPTPGIAALSKAFCLMSPSVRVPPAQALAAIMAANELEPLYQTYLVLGMGLLDKKLNEAELTEYFEREHQRLAGMDYHRPRGKQLLAARLLVADVLVKRCVAQRRYADADRYRSDLARLRQIVADLGK